MAKIQSGDLVWARRNSPSLERDKLILSEVVARKLDTVSLRPVLKGRRWSTKVKDIVSLKGSTRLLE